MPVNLDFHNIRPIEGDQRKGFEEMVCQLARKENIPQRVRFVRKGTPDAGLECYAIREDGSEWGWQAKFFLGKIDWSQMDQSVNTALRSHPNLRKMIFALPLDLPDAGLPGQTSAQEKWDKHVAKWKQEAGHEMEFVLWGASDIIAKLQQPGLAGFVEFWFDQTFLTADWFHHQMETAIFDMGPRYSSELDLELEIGKVFDGLSFNSRFIERVKNEFYLLCKNVLEFCRNREEELADVIEFLKTVDEEIKNQVQKFQTCSDFYYDFSELSGILQCCQNRLLEKERELHNRICEVQDSYRKRYEESLQTVDRLFHSFVSQISFLENAEVRLHQNPFLLLKGDAGAGKSHLLAQIVKHRAEESCLSVLLLGQKFSSQDDPRRQILAQLDLNCNFAAFLAALHCQAQIQQKRVILFIDAINEGSGKEIWPANLNGLCHEIRQYPSLGLVLSVRSSYCPVFQENLSALDFVEVEHSGFQGASEEAIHAFTDYYHISRPDFPILEPEFCNPLFLKLFCTNLHRQNITQFPRGFHSILQLFESLLDNANRKLSQPPFSCPPEVRPVQKIVQAMANYWLKQNKDAISFEEATSIIQKLSIHGDCISALISEGLFWKDIDYSISDTFTQSNEVLRFSYERLGDYLKTSSLLDSVHSKEQLQPILEEWLGNDRFYNPNTQGILETLSILVPERFGKELFELAPDPKDERIRRAFVYSIPWRNRFPSLPEIRLYLKDVIKYDGFLFSTFFDSIVSLSVIPKHPLNANWLHQLLWPQSLANRDAWWIPLTNQSFKENGTVKRLVDWAFAMNNQSIYSNESLLLAGTILAWFLASSNRKLRDYATKGMGNLFQNRLELLPKLLTKFRDVNDPYILERLYAVTYGCVLRTKQRDQIKAVSELVYEQIFNADFVYPHVLLRDYARGVIEYALYLNLAPQVDEARIRPPYRSEFPAIPTDEEIKRREYIPTPVVSNADGYVQSLERLFASMEVDCSRERGHCFSYGDFGRYVFQSAFAPWKEKLNPIDLKNIAIIVI